MTKEELQSLAQKIKDGNGTDAEKLSYVKELNSALKEASEILNKAQKV